MFPFSFSLRGSLCWWHGAGSAASGSAVFPVGTWPQNNGTRLTLYFSMYKHWSKRWTICSLLTTCEVFKSNGKPFLQTSLPAGDFGTKCVKVFFLLMFFMCKNILVHRDKLFSHTLIANRCLVQHLFWLMTCQLCSLCFWEAQNWESSHLVGPAAHCCCYRPAAQLACLCWGKERQKPEIAALVLRELCGKGSLVVDWNFTWSSLPVNAIQAAQVWLLESLLAVPAPELQPALEGMGWNCLSAALYLTLPSTSLQEQHFQSYIRVVLEKMKGWATDRCFFLTLYLAQSLLAIFHPDSFVLVCIN